MYKDIQHWVRSCVDCQMRKTPRNRKRAPLLPFPVEGAFDRVAVDCLGPFPESYSGNRNVVVFSDYLTRWPEAFAVSTIDAVVIAKLLVNEIFCRHGSPKTLLSDRGRNFLSKLVKEVCKLLSTDKLNTSTYHPMTGGLVERFNSYILQSLSMFVSDNQKDWDEFLPSILFAYRTSPQATTGDSPFYLMYGREPRLPIGLSKKLLHHWHGPYRIVKQLSPVNFKLRNSANRLVAAPVHVNRMKLYYDAKDRPMNRLLFLLTMTIFR